MAEQSFRLKDVTVGQDVPKRCSSLTLKRKERLKIRYKQNGSERKVRKCREKNRGEFKVQMIERDYQ
jgi:hypothetical protein